MFNYLTRESLCCHFPRAAVKVEGTVPEKSTLNDPLLNGKSRIGTALLLWCANISSDSDLQKSVDRVDSVS